MLCESRVVRHWFSATTDVSALTSTLRQAPNKRGGETSVLSSDAARLQQVYKSTCFLKKKKKNTAHPIVPIYLAFPGGSVVKNPPAEGSGSIPGLGRSPARGHGNPHQYSCLESPWTEEPVGYSPWGRKESDRTEHACTHLCIHPSIIRLHADRHRHSRTCPRRWLWPHRSHGVGHACCRTARPSLELTPLSATASVSDTG